MTQNFWELHVHFCSFWLEMEKHKFSRLAFIGPGQRIVYPENNLKTVLCVWTKNLNLGICRSNHSIASWEAIARCNSGNEFHSEENQSSPSLCTNLFIFLHFSPSKPISTKKASQGKTSRADFYVDGHLPRSPRRSRKCHSCLWPGLLISSCHFKYIWWLPCKIWLYLFQFSSLQTSLQAVNLDSRDPAVPLNYAVFLNKLGKVSIKKTMMSLGRVWHLRGTYYVYVCFLKNPPGFLAFEKSSSNLTSNRPFWLKQIYRDIKFPLKRLPRRCDTPVPQAH